MKLNPRYICLMLVVFVATWTISFTAAAKPKEPEQVLRFAEAATDAGTLNVNTSGQAQDLVIYDLVYEKLMEFPQRGLPGSEVVPHVAESWKCPMIPPCSPCISERASSGTRVMGS